VNCLNFSSFDPIWQPYDQVQNHLVATIFHTLYESYPQSACPIWLGRCAFGGVETVAYVGSVICLLMPLVVDGLCIKGWSPAHGFCLYVVP